MASVSTAYVARRENGLLSGNRLAILLDGDALDARAAFDARFAFTFVNLPEPFKRFTVRETVRLLQIDSRG